jgi:hypothetical protein
MNHLFDMKWISELSRRLHGNGSNRFRYWETEGLCKVERTPTVVIPGVLIGSALTQREYCVRR